MAELGEVPFALYYGSVDSTPLFVMLAGLYFERTGDVATLEALWPAIEAALAWIDGPGDRDRDGFLEYARATDQGLQNQGWKDSLDSVFHADGRLADGPIALVRGAGLRLCRQAAARRARRAAIGHGDRAAHARARGARARRSASSRRSGARTSACTRSRSTGRSSRAACAPPMPDRC